MDISNISKINPFNCSLIEELIINEGISTQNIIIKENNENMKYCLGFNVNSKNHSTCCQCPYFYFISESGIKLLEKIKEMHNNEN